MFCRITGSASRTPGQLLTRGVICHLAQLISTHPCNYWYSICVQGLFRNYRGNNKTAVTTVICKEQEAADFPLEVSSVPHLKNRTDKKLQKPKGSRNFSQPPRGRRGNPKPGSLMRKRISDSPPSRTKETSDRKLKRLPDCNSASREQSVQNQNSEEGRRPQTRMRGGGGCFTGTRAELRVGLSVLNLSWSGSEGVLIETPDQETEENNKCFKIRPI